MTRPQLVPCPPPPCPPDPWPMIGKAWHEMQAFREMLWQVLLDMSMTDPQFSALLQNMIINALVTDPRINQVLQDMTSNFILNSDTLKQEITNYVVNTTEIKQLIQTTPRIGITDGSNAAPGEVGEWIKFTTPGSFIGPSAALQTFQVASGTLPAGDWDISGLLAIPFNIDGAGWFPHPVPAGLDADMQGRIMGAPSVLEWGLVVPAPLSRGTFSVPTPLSFQVEIVNNNAATTSGTFGLIINCRRVR